PGILPGAAFFCAAMVALPNSALAQTITGVTGTVQDASGGVISGATVQVKNNATGTVATAVTSSSGTYTEEGLLPGRYTITVTAPGFGTTVKNDVTIDVTVR